jgi:hypothetical protein
VIGSKRQAAICTEEGAEAQRCKGLEVRYKVANSRQTKVKVKGKAQANFPLSTQSCEAQTHGSQLVLTFAADHLKRGLSTLIYMLRGRGNKGKA